MNLTPLDIRRQQFARVFRGYEPTEVDTFLKQISDQMESMLDEVRHAGERVREAEAKLKHYERVELALQEALESARETARRAEATAEAKAKLILEQAELKAERLVHDAERERYGLRQDLAKLNSRQTEVAARLRGFLLSELEVLAQFQGDDPVGFIKLQSGQAPGGALPPPQAQIAAGAERSEPTDAPAAPPEPPAAEPDLPHESLEDLDEEAYEDASLEGGAPQPYEPLAALAEETREEEPPPPTDAPASSESDQDGWASPPAEPPTSGAYVSDEPDAMEPPHAPSVAQPAEPAPPPAVTGGWDLRSLVTGEERNVAASEAERERIRRILDDLD